MRYIDADKMVSKDNAYTTFPHDLAGCDDNDLVRWINEQPTADVVPKSEVEEIFAEIERNIYKLETPYQVLSCLPDGLIAELKKKYTEGEQNGSK